MTDKTQTELFVEWLDNFLDYERIKKKGGFSLDTMRFLVERCHHPERDFSSVHIAGSKGKGSVSTMIASILAELGQPTGLYTSPHLIDFTERVGTPRGPFDDSIYGKACDAIVPLIDSIIPGSIPGGNEPSWFELVTLFAFVTFREAGIPWAAVETGLGGRLDATNVLTPKASVITPIELEHTEYLGDTIGKIAGEKAGIIKKGIPVFLAAQKTEARNVFEGAARAHGSPVFSMEDAIGEIRAEPSRNGLTYGIHFNRLPGGAVFSRPLAGKLRLVNAVQAENAALAAYTAKYLFPDATEGAIERGLERAWLPGRFEFASDSADIVLDGAHTVRSVALTLETFRSVYGAADAHLVFACAADKAVDEMAELFSTGFSRITVTRPGERKQSDIVRAAKAFARAFDGKTDVELSITADYSEAIAIAVDRAKKSGVPLLITGSFYLVAEAKTILSSR